MNKIDHSKRGGSREGAGRKAGTGKFREPTSVLRIPESQTSVIKDFLSAYSPIEIKEGISFEVWGVVIGSFRRFR